MAIANEYMKILLSYGFHYERKQVNKVQICGIANEEKGRRVEESEL